MQINICVSLDTDVLSNAIASANARGVELAAYIGSLVSADTANVGTAADRPSVKSTHDWLKLGLKRVKALEAGKEFLVRNLYTPEEWSAIPTHQVFGRKFGPALKNSGLGQYVRTSKANQSIYIRL
jgi:hypothetical protein